MKTFKEFYESENNISDWNDGTFEDAINCYIIVYNKEESVFSYIVEIIKNIVPTEYQKNAIEIVRDFDSYGEIINTLQLLFRLFNRK